MSPWQFVELELAKRGKPASWLAAQVGVSSQAVSNWKARGIPPKMIRKVAQALNVTADELEGEVETTAGPEKLLKALRIRRLNEFMAERGIKGSTALGRAIGRSTSQASNLLTGIGSFGEKLARSIEEKAGLPNGWLDQSESRQLLPIGNSVTVRQLMQLQDEVRLTRLLLDQRLANLEVQITMKLAALR